MRISLSFSFDISEDANLLQWLESQPNRSETARQALYNAMGAVEMQTPALLAATRRIEAELNELKALILNNAGGFKHVGPVEPPSYVPSLDDPTLTAGAAVVLNDAADVLSNLRKLKK